MSGGPAAVCRGVTKIYRGTTGETRALESVDATIPSGALTVVMGPSGSGKSTLLLILAALDGRMSGVVEVGGARLDELSVRRRRKLRRRQIGFVFQRPSDNLISYLTVRQHLELAAAIRGAGSADIVGMASALGLEDRLHNRPHELSGGEQQRVAFAQAALGNPALVIADEPTAELDQLSGAAIINRLKEMASQGSSIVVATHDPEVALKADEKIFLADGRVTG